jgi:hypothetical protein
MSSHLDLQQLPSSSRDGDGAGDHDEPYRFGRRPSARWSYPFTERQYARLLILRGRTRDNLPCPECDGGQAA